MSDICGTCKKPKTRTVVVNSVVGNICPECGWMEGQTLPVGLDEVKFTPAIPVAAQPTSALRERLADDILRRIAKRYANCEVRIFPDFPELTPVEAVLRCAQEEGFFLTNSTLAERDKQVQVLTSSDVSTRTYLGPANADLTTAGDEQPEIRPIVEQAGRDRRVREPEVS